MSSFIHRDLVKRWQSLSFLEQMANIGSEVNRALRWQKENKELFENAAFRALELLDLTILNSRQNRSRLKELTRLREVFCDAILGGQEYHSSLKDLERYFYHFALAVNLTKKNR
ncbi:MAG: hypothetical protein ACPL4K_02440 [Candidatus Margulisiibacteriota bacterium]